MAVNITYSQGGGDRVEAFDLVIVACDPRPLIESGALTPSTEEAALFSGVEHYTFRTRLFRARAERAQKHGVIFSPSRLQPMDAGLYAFRNETAKHRSLRQANRLLADGGTNLVTTYQISKTPLSAAEFNARLEQDLDKGVPWWPFDELTPVDPATADGPVELAVPYFAHFTQRALVERAPWRLLEMQGQQKTIYVHAFSCFESVLHCWQYIDRVFEAVRDRLPWRDRPVAIVGAGVSGLLAARKLRHLGFERITLLEKSERYGGKTATCTVDDVVCELGTCYLSPAYDPLIEAFEPYLEGNSTYDFARNEEDAEQADTAFRAVATEGQFSSAYGRVDDVLPFKSYARAKATDYWLTHKALPRPFADLAALELVRDLNAYGKRHRTLLGEDRPLPADPPEALLTRPESFGAYLERTGMGSLVGALQYAYSVQGYGILDEIPAYYGLLWVTPETTDPIHDGLLSVFDPSDDVMVTAWRRGWGDIWRQLVDRERLGDSIKLGVAINAIERA